MNRNPFPADIRAPLTFICPQEEKPVFNSSALTGGAPEILFEIEDRMVAIGDMRAVADGLSLDREGFEFHRHESAAGDLRDDDALDGRYYPEMEAYLRRRFAATRVVIFDATRRSDDSAGAENRDGPRGPAWRVHVDYTVKSGPQRVSDILGEAEAARIDAAGARIFQVNIWRPIHGPVARTPLAVADAASVKPEELIETDQVFPDRTGEIYHLAHAPTQQWYYAPAMTADEIILIKGWDSRDDGRARFTPHGAFTLPDTPTDAPPRESIELRALVIEE
ncbi:MAG: methyltransferase [Rhodospirillaceae bacterium]|nr:methyltransferase [Rhodospirillaceae bacterium]